MVIIRRNPDGSIASTEGHNKHNLIQHYKQRQVCKHYKTLADQWPLMNEIATKVNNAKDKPKKLKVLKEHDSQPLRQVLKGAFDPNIEWLLPKGDDVPYKKNEAPIGTDHTLLSQEAKRLYLFTKGGDNTISNTKRETLIHSNIRRTICRRSRFFR